MAAIFDHAHGTIPEVMVVVRGDGPAMMTNATLTTIAADTITTSPPRFETRADPLTPVLTGAIDMAAAIARIERRIGPSR